MNKIHISLSAALALGIGSLLFSAPGCTSGLSTQDAYDACEHIGLALPPTGNAAMPSEFNACVACFENCDDCTPKGTSPETFGCPGDDESSTSSTGSAGGSGS